MPVPHGLKVIFNAMLLVLVSAAPSSGQSPYDPIARWSKEAASSTVVFKCTSERKGEQVIFRITEVWKNTLAKTEFETYFGSGYLAHVSPWRGGPAGQNLIFFYGPVIRTSCGTMAIRPSEFIGEEKPDVLVLDVGNRASHTYTFAQLRTLIIPDFPSPENVVAQTGSAAIGWKTAGRK